MEVFNKIIDLLNDGGIDYNTLQHEVTLTSEDSSRIRGDALSAGAKAILLKVQDEFALFVFAADRKLNTKLIKQYYKAQGKRAKKTRFASADELLDMTGLVPGSVPPFGRPILDFELYVDPSLQLNERISFNAGSLTNSVNMKLRDYIELSKPIIFEFTDS